MRRTGWLVLAVLAFLPVLARTPTRAAEPPRLVVAEFDYSDSSGEPGDQRAAHAARLRNFAEALRADLSASGHYIGMALPCAPCSAGENQGDALLKAAREAGARYLVFGGIHKMSTLIQWARVEMVDLSTGKLVYDKLLSFRGDSDEAWHRAEGFLAAALVGLRG